MSLSAPRIQALLTTSRYGRALTVLSETGSTNDDARTLGLQGAADGHVVVADHQSRGRGSRGRTWVSPAGLDLYLSLVARVPLAIAELPPLTLAVGLAVAEAVESYLPVGPPAAVKWPNDVWLDRKKCAGILVESASSGSESPLVVIGIGVNVNRRAFPEGLDTTPTSLALAGQLAAGEELEREAVLATLLGRLEHWVDRFVTAGPGPIVSALEQRLALRNERARCDALEGIVTGVSREGALLMRTDEGLQRVFAGTLRPAG